MQHVPGHVSRMQQKSITKDEKRYCRMPGACTQSPGLAQAGPRGTMKRGKAGRRAQNSRSRRWIDQFRSKPAVPYRMFSFRRAGVAGSSGQWQ